MKLIYLDAPFAYFMGYMACLAFNSSKPVLATLFVLCYLGIHVLAIYEYDRKYK